MTIRKSVAWQVFAMLNLAAALLISQQFNGSTWRGVLFGACVAVTVLSIVRASVAEFFMTLDQTMEELKRSEKP